VINGINVGISFIARNVDNALVAYDSEGFWKIGGDLCLLPAAGLADPGDSELSNPQTGPALEGMAE